MSRELQLIQVGDTLELRIPEVLVDKYGLQDKVVVEEREDGLLIHARQTTKLSWEETYRQMATENEDWSDCQNLQDEDEL